MLRYIFQAGFLDGKQGFMWHVLQGFWYRFLVDAKIWESPLYPPQGGLKKESERARIVGWLREKYGIS